MMTHPTRHIIHVPTWLSTPDIIRGRGLAGWLEFITHGAAVKVRDLGALHVVMGARLMLNDGQHRRAPVEKALPDAPEPGDENIPVSRVPDPGPKRRQQLYEDLNQHPPRASLITRCVRDSLPHDAETLADPFKRSRHRGIGHLFAHKQVQDIDGLLGSVLDGKINGSEHLAPCVTGEGPGPTH